MNKVSGSEEVLQKNAPPYLSVGRIEKLMELIETRTLNEVDAAYFRIQGFGSQDAQLAMSALKFLNLINADGSATPNMKKMQFRGESGKKEREIIIKNAYKDLFDRAPNAYELSRDELQNELMHVYDVSLRVAKAAAPAFLKFSEYAGWRDAGSLVGKIKNNVPASRNKKESAVSKKEQLLVSDLTQVTIVPDKLSLLIPQGLQEQVWSNDELNDDLRKLTKAIREFGIKHLPSDEKSEQ